MTIGPDFQPRPSQCTMYAYNESTAGLFLSGEYPGNVSVTGVEEISCEAVPRGPGGSNYTYNKR